MTRFACRHLTGICAAVSVGSQYVLARFARRHLWGICAAVSVGPQCVVARFARRHLWGICAAGSVWSQRVVARFARRHLTRICAAVSVGSQYVVARFTRRHLKGICAAVNVGVAVRGGSRVLALILLVFVHHYNRTRRHCSCVQSGMVKLSFVPKCSVGHCPTSDVHRRWCFSAHIRKGVDGICGWLESLL